MIAKSGNLSTFVIATGSRGRPTSFELLKECFNCIDPALPWMKGEKDLDEVAMIQYIKECMWILCGLSMESKRKELCQPSL